MNSLNVFYEGILVGILSEDNEERLKFSYSQDWLKNKDSFALSRKLPLKEEAFGHLDTKSFFENLLPEGEVKKILERHSKTNIEGEFDFLKKYGIDCSGAFIITPEQTIKKTLKKDRKTIPLETIYSYLDKQNSLTDAIIFKEGGRFSLAGAQDKFPIIFENGKIEIPLNDEPTTHILKPAIRYHKETADTPYNEFFSMKLAKTVGLNVPEVHLIDGEHPLYIVERFDRIKLGKEIKRLHIQDFCQAQGFTSKKKYEIDSGPSLSSNFKLIKDVCEKPLPDLKQFMTWIWFNLFIGNNDCHSKNLSLLSLKNQTSLSPFYDLLSTSIYKSLDPTFSYKIGGQSSWNKLKIRHFERLASEFQVPTETLLKTGTDLEKKIKSKLPALTEEISLKFPSTQTFEKIEKETLKRINHLIKNVYE